MKNRIIGIIILCIVLIPLVYLGGNYFRVASAIMGALALKELLSLKETKNNIPSFVKLLAYVSVIFIIFSKYNINSISLYIDYRIISIIFAFFLIPLIIYSDIDKYNIMDAIYVIGIVLLIGFVFNLIIFIRQYDLIIFIYLLLISSSTDTFAYIAGNLSGRDKLSPKLSPKKTIVGLVVGVIFGTIVASTFYFVNINDEINVLTLLSCTLFLSILGQLGDLVFSSIKRYYNRKDFSSIIFGHGGVLDRFDSLIFIVIGYVLFISIL